MRLRTKIIAALLPVVSMAGLGGLGCGSSGSGGGGGTCDTLGSYTATVTTSSFATDVYPILSNMDAQQFGCGQQLICHGEPSMAIDMGGTMTLKFTDAAATVLTALKAPSINAPGMPRVTAGDLTHSLLAYKVSDKATLACANGVSPCTGTTMSNHTTMCGDIMPSVGMINPADRTKILDWIKLGAMP
jgi:hypothetical protein